MNPFEAVSPAQRPSPGSSGRASVSRDGSLFADGAPLGPGSAAGGPSGPAQGGGAGGGAGGGGSAAAGSGDGGGAGRVPSSRVVPSDLEGERSSALLRRTFEGLRAGSTRASVFVRYLVYVLVVLVAAGVTHGVLAETPWHTGGVWMLVSSAFIAVTASVGTWFYANKRSEMIHQMHKYLFQLVLLPGTGLAVLAGAAYRWIPEDALGNALVFGLPWLFVMSVLFPPIIFVKVVVGLRDLHRVKDDDEEMLTTWTRQDGHMR